jgi:hypothetical protein
MAAEATLHPPGSLEAIARGCLCPLLENDYGRGKADKTAQVVERLLHPECPVHPLVKIDDYVDVTSGDRVGMFGKVIEITNTAAMINFIMPYKTEMIRTSRLKKITDKIRIAALDDMWKRVMRERSQAR